MNKVIKSFILPLVFLVGSVLMFTQSSFACSSCGYNGYNGYGYSNGYGHRGYNGYGHRGYNGYGHRGYNGYGGYGGGVRYIKRCYVDSCCNRNYVTYKTWCRYVKRCYTDCCGCVKYYTTRYDGCCPVKWVIKYNCNRGYY